MTSTTDDRSFSDIVAGPSDAFNLDAFSLLNLRLGAGYEDYDFVVYVDNLTVETPQLGVTNLPGGPGIYADGSGTLRFVGAGRPLTAGLKITKHF